MRARNLFGRNKLRLVTGCCAQKPHSCQRNSNATLLISSMKRASRPEFRMNEKLLRAFHAITVIFRQSFVRPRATKMTRQAPRSKLNSNLLPLHSFLSPGLKRHSLSHRRRDCQLAPSPILCRGPARWITVVFCACLTSRSTDPRLPDN